VSWLAIVVVGNDPPQRVPLSYDEKTPIRLPVVWDCYATPVEIDAKGNEHVRVVFTFEGEVLEFPATQEVGAPIQETAIQIPRSIIEPLVTILIGAVEAPMVLN
jgi:hypothetical protein